MRQIKITKWILLKIFYTMDNFKIIVISEIKERILFLLANETNEKFEDLFDYIFHIIIMLYDIESVGKDSEINQNEKIKNFWVEFSKYSKLFLNAKSIDESRLKKLFSLLENKLQKKI